MPSQVQIAPHSNSSTLRSPKNREEACAMAVEAGAVTLESGVKDVSPVLAAQLLVATFRPDGSVISKTAEEIHLDLRALFHRQAPRPGDIEPTLHKLREQGLVIQTRDRRQGQEPTFRPNMRHELASNVGGAFTRLMAAVPLSPAVSLNTSGVTSSPSQKRERSQVERICAGLAHRVARMSCALNEFERRLQIGSETDQFLKEIAWQTEGASKRSLSTLTFGQRKLLEDYHRVSVGNPLDRGPIAETALEGTFLAGIPPMAVIERTGDAKAQRQVNFVVDTLDRTANSVASSYSGLHRMAQEIANLFQLLEPSALPTELATAWNTLQETMPLPFGSCERGANIERRREVLAFVRKTSRFPDIWLRPLATLNVELGAHLNAPRCSEAKEVLQRIDDRVAARNKAILAHCDGIEDAVKQIESFFHWCDENHSDILLAIDFFKGYRKPWGSTEMRAAQKLIDQVVEDDLREKFGRLWKIEGEIWLFLHFAFPFLIARPIYDDIRIATQKEAIEEIVTKPLAERCRRTVQIHSATAAMRDHAYSIDAELESHSPDCVDAIFPAAQGLSKLFTSEATPLEHSAWVDNALREFLNAHKQAPDGLELRKVAAEVQKAAQALRAKYLPKV